MCRYQPVHCEAYSDHALTGRSWAITYICGNQRPTNMDHTLGEVLSRITEEGIKNVRFEYLDTNAVSRSKTVPSRHFKEFAEHGINFPLILHSADPLANIATESDICKKYLFSDMSMFPDLSTFTVLPWATETARVYISGTRVCATGAEINVDPRVILQNQLKALKERNLSIFAAFEYEFWVVDGKSRKPITDGINCYATLRLAKHREFFDRVAEGLFGAGVDVECVETEYAKGQFEITMQPAFGIRAADNAATLRTGVKEMASQEGYLASFMSKPYEDEEGGSAHLNHSLWSADGKKSMMGDQTRPYGFSEAAEHWIAGILAHAPAMSFLQAPTHSCRPRFKQGSFAPFNATWGIDNRTCAVRAKGVGPNGGYLENRMCSNASNPYISLAATIAAGIDGIDRKLPLPPPKPFNEETGYEDDAVLLPTDMDSALRAVEADAVMKKAIGSDIINALEHIRRIEQKSIKPGNEYESYRNLYFEYV